MGFFHYAKKPLEKRVRQCQQLVVINLYDERDLMGVLPRHRAEHAKRHDVFGIEVLRIRSK